MPEENKTAPEKTGQGIRYNVKYDGDKWKTHLSVVKFANILLTQFGHMADNPLQYHTNYQKYNNYCLQFVVRGKGLYFVNNRMHTLGADTLFLLPKNSYHYYKADPDDPYEYYWMHISGPGFENFLQTIGLSEQSPILYDVKNPAIAEKFREMEGLYDNENFPFRDLVFMAKCYELLYEIATATHRSEPYFDPKPDAPTEAVIGYITEHYTERITLEKLADVANINKCYLVDVFKRNTGLPPIQYLLQYRVSKACHMLETDATITEICYACGFQELANFIVRFKNITGVTPSAYRKNLRGAQAFNRLGPSE